MNYSPYGGLCQSFIIMAIDHYIKYVLSRSREELVKHIGGFISEDAWIGIANDMRTKWDAMYKAPGSKTE
jgi:hypothetical protein